MTLLRTIAATLIIAFGVVSVAFADTLGLDGLLSAPASSQAIVASAPIPGA